MEKISKWAFNPIVLSAVIATCIYYIHSRNYITKANYKENLKISKQRYANIRTAIILFVILVVVLFVIKSVKPAKIKKEAIYSFGQPPF